MRITTRDLEQALKRGLPSLCILHGDEPFLIQDSGNRLRAAAREQGFIQRHVFIQEGRGDWSPLLLCLKNGSLFEPQRVVEIQIPSGKPGAEGARHLIDLAHTPPDQTLILILLPELDFRSQKSDWFTALEKRGWLLDLKPLPPAQLPEWIASQFERQDQQIDRMACEWLASAHENNLLGLSQTITRLSLTAPPGKVSIETLREVVLPDQHQGLDDLLTAFGQAHLGQFALALRRLRASGEPLPLILWALSEELRAMLHLSESKRTGAPLQQACQEARIWGERRNRLTPLINRIDPRRCRQALRRAARLDRSIKGLSSDDPWTELLDLGMSGFPCPPVAQPPSTGHTERQSD